MPSRDLIRSELVFFETPNGGAVFSVGSISFCGNLPPNDFDNNISRMLDNVLGRFGGDGTTDALEIKRWLRNPSSCQGGLVTDTGVYGRVTMAGRNLIVCCDGTWNDPKNTDEGVPAPTNVFRLFNAVDLV